jgi:hypothetical protein
MMAFFELLVVANDWLKYAGSHSEVSYFYFFLNLACCTPLEGKGVR